MATLAELRAFITDIIPNDDSRFDADDIDAYLNQAINEIAGGTQATLGSFLTPPLPDLFKIDTVDTATDAAFVSMPATYQRDLHFACNENGIEIDIANSWIEFAADNPLLDRPGRMYEVIEHGSNLYYQGIPAVSEEISIHFYRLPVDMDDDDDTPDGIPLHLQRPLLVNYVCKEIFNLIENGMDGPKVDTELYTAKFLRALRTLELSLPFDTHSLKLSGD